MTRLRALGCAVVLIASGCKSGSTAPHGLEGSYTLTTENDQALPSDPSAPFGCCLTLSGSLTLTNTTYDLRTSHRNKSTGITFENAEQGTYTEQGNALSFTRTGGGGEGFPYLLGTGQVSSDGDTIMLLYGDEGPGSDQIRGTFER